MVYGATLPTWTYALDSALNGDTFAQAFTGAPTVSVGGATSTSNHYTAGAHALTGATGSAASQLGYAVSSTVAGGTLTVTPRTLTVTYTGDNKIYDGNTTATVNDSDNRVSSDGFTIAETAAFSNANAGVGKTINVTGIGLSGTDAANYTVDSTATTTATITPRTVTLSGNRVYDGTTALGAGAVTLGNLVGAQTLVYSGASASDAHVATSGKHVSAIALLDGANGGLASNYQLPTLNAANAPLIITARAIAGSAAIGGTLSRTYDGTIAANGANLSGSVSGAASGDVIVLDTSAISLAYNSAHAATATSIGASGAAGFSIGSSTNGSLASDYSFTAPVISSVTASITPATLTPTLTNSGVTKVYDGATSAPAGFTPTWNISGLIAGDTAASLTNSGAAFNNKDVLTANSITVSGLGVGAITGGNGSLITDYVLDATSKSVAASITSRSVTVAGLVAHNKVYDNSNVATLSNAGSVATGVGSETLNLSSAGATFSDANAGIGKVVTGTAYAISDGADGGLASNYTLTATTATTTATVTPRTVTLFGNRVYDGTTALGAGAVTVGNLVGAQTLDFSGASASDAHVATSGKYVSAITLLDGANGGLASNYQLPTLNAADAPVTITPRALNAIATIGGVFSKVYDGSTAATGAIVSGSVTGGVSGDTILLDASAISLAYNSARVASATSIGASGALGFSIDSSANGSLAGDYSFTAPVVSSVAASITPRTLLVNYGGVDKVYDGKTNASVTITDNRIAGDALAITALAAFADKNVGVGKAVTIGGVTLGGADAGNYLVSASGLTTANITRLGSVAWTGGANGDWFDPANWAGGAVPDLSNVANVILPAGTDARFDVTGAAPPAQTGAVNLESLGAAGRVTQNNGELRVGAGGVRLDGYTQNGGVLAVDGDVTLSSFTQAGGSNAIKGKLTIGATSPAAEEPPVPPPALPAPALPTPDTAPPISGMGLMNVSVALVTAPTNQTPGLVAVEVPKDMTSKGFTFALPEEVTKDVPADARITATREDGGVLPAWLTYDAKSRRFVATQIPANALPMRVLVTIGARQTTVVISASEDFN